MTKPEFIAAEMGTRVTAHALHVGDRINTMGFESGALSAVPLAIRVGKTGIAVLFRYGVAVLIGLSPEDEIGFLEKLKPRIGGRLARFEEETAIVALAGEAEDQPQAGRPDRAEHDQVAGCATPLMTSRSAVSVLPLVSGPSSTEITTRTRKSIVLIIIGMAKPKFICTAR